MHTTALTLTMLSVLKNKKKLKIKTKKLEYEITATTKFLKVSQFVNYPNLKKCGVFFFMLHCTVYTCVEYMAERDFTVEI